MINEETNPKRAGSESIEKENLPHYEAAIDANAVDANAVSFVMLIESVFGKLSNSNSNGCARYLAFFGFPYSQYSWL